MRMKASRLQIKLMQIYMLFVPFLSAFSISAWLPLPLLYMISASIYLLVTGKFLIFKEDWEIIIIVLLGILSLAFSPNLGTKNFNHTLAISTSVFFSTFRSRILSYDLILLVLFPKQF